ncbi:hypothetical protein, partial [Streptococcus gordonii]|uniref:hypothetical protein n=1 Tax=Streptococcus gordonii TaxID=1302 RepID=UPI0030C7B7A3
ERRVLLTNHAYLLTRLEDDKSMIEGRMLVVDEAQKLCLALESFSQKALKMNQLLQTIQQEKMDLWSYLEMGAYFYRSHIGWNACNVYQRSLVSTS